MGSGVVECVRMLRKLGWVVTEYRMQLCHILAVRMLRMHRMQL